MISIVHTFLVNRKISDHRRHFIKKKKSKVKNQNALWGGTGGREFGQTSMSLSLSEPFIDENNEVGEPGWESFNRSRMYLVLESLHDPLSLN